MKDKKFVAAVFLAALFGMERFGFRPCLRAAWDVLLALTARRGRVDPAIASARMRTCEQCPIFFSPLTLQTCGSPVADDHTLGCWCHMPTKVLEPNATCWADENLDLEELGWKTLNPPKPLSTPSTPGPSPQP
jgi:hypothetical protein